MAVRTYLRSRTARWILPAALVSCCAGQAASPQAAPASRKRQVPSQRGISPGRRLSRISQWTAIRFFPRMVKQKPSVAESTPAAPSAPGAQPGDRTLTKQGNGFVLRADVDEVLLPSTVVDDKGQLVTNLDRGDFQVWEDNVPQKIASFQHQDVPISLGILVDNSGSMRDKRAAINDAALHLVKFRIRRMQHSL